MRPQGRPASPQVVEDAGRHEPGPRPARVRAWTRENPRILEALLFIALVLATLGFFFAVEGLW